MGIKQSVGLGGINNKVDVKVIQAALNLSQLSFVSEDNVVIDGVMGKRTILAITRYQEEIVGMSKPDGRVDPNGTTIKSLKNR